MDAPPPPERTFEPLDDEALEGAFEALATGDYHSIEFMKPWERKQVEAYVLGRLCQWVVQLEQRTRT